MSGGAKRVAGRKAAMSPGAAFERVHLALKEQLGTARYAAGQSLEPAALSHDLNASITPVRDALHQRVGEGLVDAPRGDDFRVLPIASCRIMAGKRSFCSCAIVDEADPTLAVARCSRSLAE